MAAPPTVTSMLNFGVQQKRIIWDGIEEKRTGGIARKRDVRLQNTRDNWINGLYQT